MINVSNATKSAYLNNSDDIQLVLYFPDLDLRLTNSNIVSESMNLSQILETENVLTFKGCNASKFEIELEDLEQDVRGERVLVSIQAGLTDTIYLFQGIVDDQNNITHEDITVKISAYDDLYTTGQTDVTDWYAGLNFPMTVKQFRDSFFNYISIAQETVTLPCDDLVMTRMVSSDVILDAQKVMQDICQANARFGLMRNGYFSYVKLQTTPETALPKGAYVDVDYDPYVMEAITKVSVADDSGVTEESYGSGTNVLKIEGNIVAYSVDRAECAEIIYGEVSGITMNSARVDLIGLPYLECGDYVTLSSRKNDLEMYILNRTLTGIQALFDSYSSTVDKYMHESNSVESQLLKRDGRLNHLYRDLDETKSTVASNKADADGQFIYQQTQITQNDRAITAEISRAQGAESDLSNTITATAAALTVQIEEIYGELDGEIAVYYREGEPTLLNYPAWDFTYNIPCNNTVKTTDTLKFEYNDDYYQQNIRDLVYDTDSNSTYRFEKENGTFYWKPIADTDFTVAMQKISQLEVTTEEISADVLAVTAELHDGYYTKAQTESRLSVKSDEILLEVSRTYTNSTDLANNYTAKSTFNQTVNSIYVSVQGKVENSTYQTDLVATRGLISSKVSIGGVSSAITQEAGQITLSSNRLIVNSDYFTLDSNGKGTLGGLTFDEYGFYSVYGGSKVLRVYPNPSSGFALSVGENVRRIIGSLPVTDQAHFSIGHEGEVYVTKLNVLNEYDSDYDVVSKGQLVVDDAITLNHGNLHVNRALKGGQWVGGQIFAGDYIECSGNIEAKYGSLYARYASGISGSGNVVAEQSLFYADQLIHTSDKRLKKNIKPLTDSEEFIYSLKPVEYQFRKDKDGKKHHGLIAQELQKVNKDEEWNVTPLMPDGKHYGICYEELIADLIKTVQSQNERLIALES